MQLQVFLFFLQDLIILITPTVVRTKSESDVIFCSQSLA